MRSQPLAYLTVAVVSYALLLGKTIATPMTMIVLGTMSPAATGSTGDQDRSGLEFQVQAQHPKIRPNPSDPTTGNADYSDDQRHTKTTDISHVSQGADREQVPCGNEGTECICKKKPSPNDDDDFAWNYILLDCNEHLRIIIIHRR